jgi:hypothetical protein
MMMAANAIDSKILVLKPFYFQIFALNKNAAVQFRQSIIAFMIAFGKMKEHIIYLVSLFKRRLREKEDIGMISLK